MKKIAKNNSKLFSALSSRAELHVDMKAKVSGSIEAQSREISRHNAVCAIEEEDFSTPLRYGRNDIEAGSLFVLIR